MEAWNKNVQKDWRYKNETNFRRDCIQAKRRLLNPLPTPETRFVRYLEKQKGEEKERVAKSTAAARKGRK